MAWLLPELELGVEPELRPLELELPELPVLELPVLELPVLELPVLELPVLELEPDEPVLEDVPLLEEVPELVDEPVDVEDVAVLWVDPGRARVTTPAAATLARVTAVVVERTLARPRSRVAMACRTLSRSALLMSPILRSRIRSLLQETSPLAMRARALGQPSGRRLPSEHEGLLKPRCPRGQTAQQR
ncbi:MAG TPA: hypothetical protein VKU77_02670 [Streptosporangiaceae bacterium]|nr:hypothetical protein [Streptosporangiaceae bacterium]